MSNRYRIILADDHPVVRSGVKMALNDFDVVAEAGDSTGLFAALETHRADVVITDYAMPGGKYQDGAVMLERLHRLYPDVKIIVLTLLKNPAILAKIAASPVDGILNKEGETKEISSAIVRVMNGMRYHGASVKLALESADLHFRPEALPLSTREIEVLRLFLAGKGMTQIAEEMRRSIKTVSNQKQSALRKLGCANDAELFQLKAVDGLGEVLQSRIGEDGPRESDE